MTDMCALDELTDKNCCATPAAEPDGVIANPPAQSALRYRLGTFATFRRRLLAGIPLRLPQWTDHSPRDYGVAFLEMWATLADILTFYQERLANEAFLRSAVLRESLVRLAALVDYRFNPGAAATTYLAFTVDQNKTVAVPASFRAQTKPAPGAPPVPFETDEAFTAYAGLNRLRPRSLQDQTLGMGAQSALLAGTRTNLRPGDRVLILGPERLTLPASVQWELRRVNRVLPDKTQNITRVEWDEPLSARLPAGTRPQVFALRLQAWPFGYNAPDYKNLTIHTTQTLIAGGVTTTVTTTATPNFTDWTGKKLPELSTHPEQLLLDSLYPTLTADTWIALVTVEAVRIPAADGTVPTTDQVGHTEVYQVLQADETVHANYTLTAKVTRLTFDTVTQIRASVGVTQPKNIDVFPMQGTSILAQSEALPLAPVPITVPVAGDTLTLDAVYADLQPGRLIVLAGQAPGNGPAQTEVARVQAVRHTSAETVVTLAANLRFTYDPVTLLIYGNIAPASQGETLADEILGGGAAAQAYQSFTLKKTPLTFLRQTGPAANRWGTQAALQVRVNDQAWAERENLLGSGPTDHAYTLSLDAQAAATVAFGAGVPVEAETGYGAGARLPTGRDNVRARYRQGLGASGNVKESAITTLVNPAPGLKAVANPLAGTGGADREREDEMKVNVPAGMRAFDRAVSLADYEALARTYSGVAKARAYWEYRDPTDPAGRRRHAQPRVVLTVAATDRTPPLQPAFKTALRAFLDDRRDPNQPLLIADFTPVSLDLDITLEPEPDFLPEKVLAAVGAALSAGRNADGAYGFFAFERLDFGLSVHLSDIYAGVQNVPGVKAALVTRFRHHARPGELDAAIPLLEPHIFIKNTEILRLDNDSTDPARGRLTLTTGEMSVS